MNTDIPAPAPLFVAPVALADGAEFIGPARFKAAQREGRSLSMGLLLRAEGQPAAATPPSIGCGAVAEGRAMASPTVPVPRC